MYIDRASLVVSGKESVSQCRRHRFNPWVRKIPWRRAWQPTPVFLPGESHEQRSLVGCSPRGHKGVGPYLAIKQQQKHRYQGTIGLNGFTEALDEEVPSR